MGYVTLLMYVHFDKKICGIDMTSKHTNSCKLTATHSYLTDSCYHEILCLIDDGGVCRPHATVFSGG